MLFQQRIHCLGIATCDVTAEVLEYYRVIHDFDSDPMSNNIQMINASLYIYINQVADIRGQHRQK